MEDGFNEDGKNVGALFRWLDIRVSNPYGSEHKGRHLLAAVAARGLCVVIAFGRNNRSSSLSSWVLRFAAYMFFLNERSNFMQSAGLSENSSPVNGMFRKSENPGMHLRELSVRSRNPIDQSGKRRCSDVPRRSI